MDDVLSDKTAEHIVNCTIPEVDGDDIDAAPFRISSFVRAEPGKTISGDDIRAIFQEAKAKGVTVASLMHKVPNARTQIVVSPGPGVVEQAPRTGGRKRKE